MASLVLLLLLSLTTLCLIPSYSMPLLSTTYDYSPKFDQIMEEITTNKQITSPTTAAATLRVFFHDCFVTGCDASVLISSTPFNKSEREADINLSLPEDGLHVVVRAKSALELSCPGVVSCADILVVSARNLVVMMGGLFYTVKLGRKDSLTSKSDYVEGNLPRSTMSVDQIIQLFQSKKFSIQEMVALSGAHTIGFSHCKDFSSILYNYSGTMESDPSYNYNFAKLLRNACAGYEKNPALSVFNDIMTPNKFDNVYYSSVQKGLGLMSSDHSLSSDSRTRGYVELYSRDQNAFFKEFVVELYSRDQNAFFKAFVSAIQKMSVYGVKTGRNNEVRRRCDGFDN